MLPPSIVQKIRDRHGGCCVSTRCEEGNCRIKLPRPAETWVCLSGTKLQENHGLGGQKLCDFIFWMEKGAAFLGCAIELKGGGSNISHVAKQIQHGATLLDQMVGDLDFSFHPVLVHAGMKTIELRELDKIKIKRRGKAYRIELIRCGEDLLAQKGLSAFR
ncbi:hypothetical protein AB0F88_36890 [Streptosporangium sp. NPDC023963]|uniref:hypothetical protein n=1 Tax=Streptosporangium sp. NPDC023963 TaxID=3155608 RepID=UPI0034206436